MPAYVTVLGQSADFFEHVQRVLLSDARFIDHGDHIHCDGTSAPLTNIYAVQNHPWEWEGWAPIPGMPNPQTMSTLLLECRDPEWVAVIGRKIADGLVEPVWLVDAHEAVWPAAAVDAARIKLT